MLLYGILFVILFIAELVYFNLANRFNIIDKPNQRSSHTQITLRGGGIIFYFAVLAFFIFHTQYHYFFLGLSLITIISFIDDLATISNTARIIIHLLSICLLSYQAGILDFSIFWILPAIIVMVGIINAYNFMDGINGITAAYSLAVLSLLYIVNSHIDFIQIDLIIYTIISVGVFAFFNFRQKARCFAGDVGSVSMAFILIFLLGKLIVHTNNLVYLLFLTVYGLDTIWTIVQRLIKKENIFEAHRTHLYQYLANEAGINKLTIALLYGVLQFIIGVCIIGISEKSSHTQIFFSLILLVVLSAFYLLVKKYVIRRFMEK